jgi:hypothetical protein
MVLILTGVLKMKDDQKEELIYLTVDGRAGFFIDDFAV